MTEDPFHRWITGVSYVLHNQTRQPRYLSVKGEKFKAPHTFTIPAHLSQIQIAILPLSDTIVSRHVMLFDKC